MAMTIAISGKGGSGKTTLTAMIMRALLGKSRQAVLGVDADPNACLALTMGIDVEDDIASIRETARQKKPNSGGMDRVQTVEFGMQQAICESKGFDLIAMGRPEGPSCYCAVNNLLRKFLDGLGSQYGFVLIDNEAGMEHLSRRTTNNIDMLCIAADATPIGVITAKRIFALANDLPITVKKIGVIWNRTDQALDVDGIETLGCVPYDEAVSDASAEGKTVFDIEADSPAYAAVYKIVEEKLNPENT